ncbi:unnamed protein product, partial [Laminaria digitata]
MKQHSQSPPVSPGKRRSTLLGGVRRRPNSPLSPVNRTYTAVPASASRGSEALRAGEAVVAVSADRRGGDVAPEDWVKVSWKKGECRDEIKLVAEASGLGFDAAQIVALRLYNHFYWLPELRERSEKLFATVARERRFSLSLVKHPDTIAAEALPHDSTADDNEAKVDAEPVAGASGHHASNDFSRYIKGLCALCNNGNFDQTLAMLFRAYSSAADHCVVTRDEVAAILASHVVYADSEARYRDPTLEQERVYRWLKRQFIQLAVTPNEASQTVDSKGESGEANPAVGVCREPGGDSGGGGGGGSGSSVISWESARQLLRSGPPCLESSLAIDLPRLSKDLWALDLVDIGRTSV